MIQEPVKLIIGFIYKEEGFLPEIKRALEKKFKKTDFLSEPLRFNYTKYYEAEFGLGLMRQFISFHKLISLEDIYKIKLFTNKLERKFSFNGRRRVNIDPGYIDMAKLVLLTTKDYTQRIYLAKGIYAENTLYFNDNTFKAWAWTYPDYKTEDYIRIFNQIRDMYFRQLKV